MDKRPHAERDAGFERLLRETLRGDASAAGSECVEPDTLAAWSEGVLSPSERSFVEAHAARCVRCQSMVAALARTVPVEPERAAWGLRQWLMMFAPAAAAATAIALWFAVEPRRTQLEQPAQQMADARNAEAPSSTVAPAKEEVRAPAERRDTPAAPSADPADAAKAVGKEVGQIATRQPELERRRQELDQLKAEAKKELARDSLRSPEAPPPAGPARVNTGNAANTNAGVNANAAANAADVNAASPQVNAGYAAAKPVAAPPPPAAATAPPEPSQIVTTVTAQSPTVQTSQAASQSVPRQADQQQFRAGAAAGAGRGGGRALERAALNEPVALAPIVVATADGSVQWRSLNDRIVQHSADKGATWATQYTLDDKSTITAGSSPTPLVAWFVGRGGLVLATTDGRTWRRIAFPEPVDLVSVLAIDARTATVTASDRRSFTTTNAGASWTAVKD